MAPLVLSKVYQFAVSWHELSVIPTSSVQFPIRSWIWDLWGGDLGGGPGKPGVSKGYIATILKKPNGDGE
jgi:hypothetical protein